MAIRWKVSDNTFFGVKIFMRLITLRLRLSMRKPNIFHSSSSNAVEVLLLEPLVVQVLFVLLLKAAVRVIIYGKWQDKGG